VRANEELFWQLVAECKEEKMVFTEAKEKIADEMDLYHETARNYLNEHNLFQDTKEFQKPKIVSLEENNHSLNETEKKTVQVFEDIKVLNSYGADFITEKYIVEVKKTLNKYNFPKAYMQLQYADQKLNNEKDLIIVCGEAKMPEGKASEFYRYLRQLNVDVAELDSKLNFIDKRDDLL